jgi:hypothetical protein
VWEVYSSLVEMSHTNGLLYACPVKGYTMLSASDGIRFLKKSDTSYIHVTNSETSKNTASIHSRVRMKVVSPET